MKKIFAKLILVIQITLYSPLILTIIISWPLLKIRIGFVKTKLLGSVAIAAEVFLCDKKEGIYKKNEVFLWFHQKKISNKYLLKKRREQMIFLPRFILPPITVFFVSI